MSKTKLTQKERCERLVRAPTRLRLKLVVLELEYWLEQIQKMVEKMDRDDERIILEIKPMRSVQGIKRAAEPAASKLKTASKLGL